MRSLRHFTRRRASRAFTLTELMIALVMGLIICLAVVALGKSATQTFHDQARLSASEGSVRTAAERLRLDLTRISQMGTGNIRLDPRVARINGATSGGAVTPWRYPALAYLAGVRIDRRSATTPALGVPTTDQAATCDKGAVNQCDVQRPVPPAYSFNPDTLLVAGNLTTNDSYGGTFQLTGGSCGGGSTVQLDANADAAVFALLAGVTTSAQAKDAADRAFMGTAPPLAGRQFLVQVRDGLGCYHYAAVCATRGISATQIEIDLANDPLGRAVLMSNPGSGDPEFLNVTPPTPPGTGNATSFSSCGSSAGGRVRISPLARARWSIKATHPTRQPLTPADQAYEGPKYDLVREILDAAGNVAWTETILEYAVDLKFGIAADDPQVPAGANALVVFDFDNAAMDAYAGPTAGQTAGLPGPQRIRSIRFRVSARTSTPDRKNAVSGVGAAPPYPVRYGTNTPATNFARIRTLVSEVGILNQAQMFY
jgi:type II secretory pathway pseudopilin PulG